jgi:hypothetical protein
MIPVVPHSAADRNMVSGGAVARPPRGDQPGKGVSRMFKRCLTWRRLLGAAAVAAAAVSVNSGSTAQAQPGISQPTDWERFYHYPYVYYPQNFQPRVQFDSLYYKYPQERRIPVYRADWYNYYPNTRPYHSGHHFELDVF